MAGRAELRFSVPEAITGELNVWQHRDDFNVKPLSTVSMLARDLSFRWISLADLQNARFASLPCIFLTNLGAGSASLNSLEAA